MSYQRQFRMMSLEGLQYYGRREAELQLQNAGWTVSYHEEFGQMFMVIRKESEKRVVLLVSEKYAQPNPARLRTQRDQVQHVAKTLDAKPVLGLFWIEEAGPQVKLLDAKSLQPVA